MKMMKQKNDYSCTGIHENCIFNDASFSAKINEDQRMHTVYEGLKNFYITENISVDVMHDVYEGIGSYTIEKVLGALIKSKIITLPQINDENKKFSYNEIDKQCKPRSLSFSLGKTGKHNLKIRQSAAEMLCLIRHLGLMIGHLTDVEIGPVAELNTSSFFNSLLSA